MKNNLARDPICLWLMSPIWLLATDPICISISFVFLQKPVINDLSVKRPSGWRFHAWLQELLTGVGLGCRVQARLPENSS